MGKTSRFVGLITTFSVLIATVWATFHYQAIVDEYIVRTQPLESSEAKLADEVKFSPHGRYLFTAVQPEIEEASDFNKHCNKKETGSVVLGCYVGPQNLYVYNVTDPRLAGVKQVTTAHEMLHAAYDRLSESERQRINRLIEAALPGAQATTPDLAERLKLYERTEPGERSNELHSILGTEVASLSPELETYYQQYFTDRSVVVAFALSYSKVFLDIKNNQEQLVRDLENLKTEIDQMSDGYNTAVESLNQAIEAFNSRASRPSGFSSQAEFETEKASLSVRRSQLEATRQTINDDIAVYNAKRTELQALNVQVEELNSKLDSSKLPSL